MTTPNFDNAGTGGYNSGTDSSTSSGKGSSSQGSPGAAKTDDVSFGQSLNAGGGGRTGQNNAGQNNAMESVKETAREAKDTAKDTMKRGISGAEDAMSQLQQKASDVTSRLINNIDVDDLTQKLEMQVREHPARTLAMAIGAGFLLGRAAKR